MSHHLQLAAPCLILHIGHREVGEEEGGLRYFQAVQHLKKGSASVLALLISLNDTNCCCFCEWRPCTSPAGVNSGGVVSGIPG